MTGSSTARARQKTVERQRGRQPKDVVLLQLALVLMRGDELTYARLHDEFLLERRSAERYMNHLRAAGLPLVVERRGREARFLLNRHRARLDVEALDVPPAAARSLSLLLVAAALLPDKLGVREAVDRTVRGALRLRGMKAAAELRRLEDAVIVLENDAKDYAGKSEVFTVLVDAVLDGSLVEVRYRSPRSGLSDERFYCASVGLYRGGLYVLAVQPDADGRDPTWRAIERVEGTPVVRSAAQRLSPAVRLRALDEARRRWGPAASRGKEQVITLEFSATAAPYVLARPWHPRAELSPLAAKDGGGLRMGLRLSGRTDMFESWVKSWGKEVRVLRPKEMADRIADELDAAAAGHRAAAAAFDALLLD